MNEKIRARDVRVIGEDGQQLGVYSLFAALNLARDRGLDLVEVAPNSIPPVCRLMDYGRYKYEQQKKEQEAHRAQRTNDLKEVRMAPVIDDHDIETKTRMIRRFVEEGDKVKVTIQFRGAQMRHQEIGRDVLERILTSLRGTAVLERPIIMEGRNMSMFVGAPAGRQGQGVQPVAPADGARLRTSATNAPGAGVDARPATAETSVEAPAAPQVPTEAPPAPSSTPVSGQTTRPPVSRSPLRPAPTGPARSTAPGRVSSPSGPPRTTRTPGREGE